MNRRWWLLPNLLSLDAPIVAVAWLYIFAQSWGVDYHPLVTYWILACAIWLISIGDRLLDVYLHGEDFIRGQTRHQFHYHYRHYLLGAMGVVSAVMIYLVLTYLPVIIFNYTYVLIVLLALFLGLSVVNDPSSQRIPVGKNILAGLIFAYGTALAAHGYLLYGPLHLLLSREFFTFALLCVVHIFMINIWNKDHACQLEDEQSSYEMNITACLAALTIFILFFVLSNGETMMRRFYFSVLTGVALMHLLNRIRHFFSIDELSALAYLALALPILVFLVF